MSNLADTQLVQPHASATPNLAANHSSLASQPQQLAPSGPKPRGRRKKVRTESVRPICPQCEKQFSNQSALTKHKLTHSDERKFACQQCSKAFKRHDHLTGHMQTHSNRKPFNCTIQGCDKTYCDARSLRRHKENIHHIVAPRESQASLSNGAHLSSNGSLIGGELEHYQAHSNGTGSSIQHHHHHHQQQQQQHRQPAINGISDSSLSLNAYYDNGQQQQHQQLQPMSSTNHGGYLTPVTLHPPTDLLNGTTEYDSSTQTTNNTAIPPPPPTCISSTTLPNNCITQDPLQHHSPSHLLKRRINRVQSDPSAQQTSASCRLLSSPINHNYNHHRDMNNYYQHHQAPYSADYVMTNQQHFTFDAPMSPMDKQYSCNGTQQQHQQPVGGPQSINDSGLSLNTYYTDQQQQMPMSSSSHGGYLTPVTLHPPSDLINGAREYETSTHTTNNIAIPPPPSTCISSTTVATSCIPQHPLQHHSPSHLLKRRINRVQSDSSAQQTSASCRLLTSPISHNYNHHRDMNNYYQHHQAPYSADYVMTNQQHFTFDAPLSPMDEQYSSNGVQQQQHLARGTQSINDSGLSLNTYYADQQQQQPQF